MTAGPVCYHGISLRDACDACNEGENGRYGIHLPLEKPELSAEQWISQHGEEGVNNLRMALAAIQKVAESDGRGWNDWTLVASTCRKALNNEPL